jgi:ankyrin repeat protein
MDREPINQRNLIHKKERLYFVVAILVSALLFLSMLTSVVGLIIFLAILVLSLFFHTLFLAYIRTNAVRLSLEQFPTVYEKAKELSQKMGINRIPDIYVMESEGILNAFATRFFGRNMVLLYSSFFELIEEGKNDELYFVLAHELAHIKRNHLSKNMLILPAMWIPGVGEAYSRACEYTCDRFAAYYTGNVEASMNSLTMLSVGTKLYKHVNRRDYLQQINEEKGFFVWLCEKLSTHPPLPKRIDEIATFMVGTESIIRKSSKGKAWIVAAITGILFVSLVGGGVYVASELDIETTLNNLLEEKMAFLEEDISPLIHSVTEGDVDQVQKLLNEGQDPNTQDDEGWSLLFWAVSANHKEMTELLLNAGANPNLEDYYGEVPLMEAAEYGYLELAALLIERGADVNYQDYSGWTPLWYAVMSGDKASVELLLDAGADIDSRDHSDSTILMFAIKQGNKEIVEMIKSKGKE